jgi:PAS domain S-box-containing protein
MDKAKLHILLVEDEEAQAELVRRAFSEASRAGQVRLTVAGSLAEARACLSESTPDLVIADWILPDGRGTELLPANGERYPYPVVLMSGHGGEQLAVEAIKAGAVDYVVKSAAALAAMPRIAERALREWGYIVERVEAEQALRESEEKLRGIIEHSTDGIALADEEGTIIEWNPGAERITGLEPTEVLGHPIWDVLDWLSPEERRTPQAREQFEVMALDLLRTGQAPWLERFPEAEIECPDGDRRIIQTSVFVIQTGQGYRVSGIVRDITQRVRMEEEREKLIAELEGALAKVKTLSGMLPICASCKKIRDDQGYWHQVEAYVRDHSDVEFSHGLCPDCARRLYPEWIDDD